MGSVSAMRNNLIASRLRYCTLYLVLDTYCYLGTVLAPKLLLTFKKVEEFEYFGTAPQCGII